MEQRFTFDEVAELYDRHRPGYPNALFEDLISVSGISRGGRILEIGCGTGQATLPLASRGFSVLCLEPGPSLARIAQRKLSRFPSVSVVTQTFEEWTAEPSAFDLVVSAQAFHWVSPEVRFSKAASVLKPGGALAVFGNALVANQSPVREALDAAYARHAPSMTGPPATRWYAEEGPIPRLFAESGVFGAVTWRHYPWSQLYSGAEYIHLLNTSSDHRLLPPEQRGRLLDAIGTIIEHHGGTIEVPYEAHLYLAQCQGR